MTSVCLFPGICTGLNGGVFRLFLWKLPFLLPIGGYDVPAGEKPACIELFGTGNWRRDIFLVVGGGVIPASLIPGRVVTGYFFNGYKEAVIRRFK
jgi:hypothetical protein